MVTPPAEIDLANAAQLLSAVEAAGPRNAVIVVDMAANRFCDSSGVVAPVRAYKRARAGGGEIWLVMGGAVLRRVFKATGMERVFRMFGTLDEAVAAGPPAPGHARRPV